MDDDEATRQAIRDLIARECTAYLCRDFDAMTACLLQEQHLRRLGALMGGIMHYSEGWEAQRRLIREMFVRHPEPNPDAAAAYKRTNWSIRLGADLAWASFDQYGPRSPDPFVTAGLSHQIRILERHGGQWKIAMLGHGDTSLEYFDYPVVQVDARLNILWMNDRAKSDLPTHPALRNTGGRLRCLGRRDTDALLQTATALDDLNIMDYRPSVDRPRGQGTRPILVEDTDGRAHVVWVTKHDEMLLVRFNDTQATASHLEDAQALYNLSPTQIRLAALILDGCDMPSAAERLGVTPNTAKTHLRRLFDKTGARSQPTLVATLLGTAPPS